MCRLLGLVDGGRAASSNSRGREGKGHQASDSRGRPDPRIGRSDDRENEDSRGGAGKRTPQDETGTKGNNDPGTLRFERGMVEGIAFDRVPGLYFHDSTRIVSQHRFSSGNGASSAVHGTFTRPVLRDWVVHFQAGYVSQRGQSRPIGDRMPDSHSSPVRDEPDRIHPEDPSLSHRRKWGGRDTFGIRRPRRHRNNKISSWGR